MRNRYVCKDGKWIICTHHPEEKYWARFCEAIEQQDWLLDSRFAEAESRRTNQAELIGLLDEIFQTRTSEEWMKIFVDKGLMFCPVLHVTEIQNDPQALDNQYMVDFQDPEIGSFRVAGYPVHFSANSAGTRCLAPSLGQHTTDVIQELGYADEEIERLKKEGVIR